MSDDAIALESSRGVPMTIDKPRDRALRSLWDLAELEVEANVGKVAETKAEWHRVTERYQQLISESKRRGELAGHQVVNEVPLSARPPHLERPPIVPPSLRPTLTAFGLALAAALEQPVTVKARWRVVSAVEAVPIMRQLLERLDLKEKKRLTYPDGAVGPSWYEEPGMMIREWVNQESAVVVKDDEQGPCEMRFFTRIGNDTVRTVYRIGDGPDIAGLGVAFWELGITRFVAEANIGRTPPSFIAKMRARGATVTDRGDGWYDIAFAMKERPARSTPERVAAWLEAQKGAANGAE